MSRKVLVVYLLLFICESYSQNCKDNVCYSKYNPLLKDEKDQLDHTLEETLEKLENAIKFIEIYESIKNEYKYWKKIYDNFNKDSDKILEDEFEDDLIKLEKLVHFFNEKRYLRYSSYLEADLDLLESLVEENSVSLPDFSELTTFTYPPIDISINETFNFKKHYKQLCTKKQELIKHDDKIRKEIERTEELQFTLNELENEINEIIKSITSCIEKIL